MSVVRFQMQLFESLFATVWRAASREALTRAGQLVQQIAQQMIRPGTAPSRPGEPPRSQTGRLRSLIGFAWDETTQRVVVGPVITLQPFGDGDGAPIGETIPAVLETGGAIRIRETLVGKTWRRDTARLQRTQPDLPRRFRAIQIAARPYMRPALIAAAPRFPELFRDILGA